MGYHLVKSLNNIFLVSKIYPGIENLILARLSREGFIHWLYWNSRTWSSSDVIVILK